MACDFINVNGKVGCEENYSGVGSKLIIVQITDAAKAAIAYDEKKAAFTEGSFAAAGCKFYEVSVKPKTGHVDSTSNPDAGGFNNVYEGRVANNMREMSYLASQLNNSEPTDWGALVGTGKPGEYYVMYDPTFGVEVSISSATGDAPDSDHGHTITITASPMKYPLTVWEGEIVIEKDPEAGA